MCDSDAQKVYRMAGRPFVSFRHVSGTSSDRVGRRHLLVILCQDRQMDRQLLRMPWKPRMHRSTLALQRPTMLPQILRPALLQVGDPWHLT